MIDGGEKISIKATVEGKKVSASVINETNLSKVGDDNNDKLEVPVYSVVDGKLVQTSVIDSDGSKSFEIPISADVDGEPVDASLIGFVSNKDVDDDNVESEDVISAEAIVK